MGKELFIRQPTVVEFVKELEEHIKNGYSIKGYESIPDSPGFDGVQYYASLVLKEDVQEQKAPAARGRKPKAEAE